MAFHVALVAALIGVILLFRPFLATLVAATVVVMVAWPLHARLLRLCGGRSALAVPLTMLALLVGVFGPIALAGWVLVNEIGAVGVEFTEELAALPSRALAFLDSPVVSENLARVTGDVRPPSEQLSAALRQAAAPAVQQLGAILGSGLGTVGGILLRTLIFFVTLGTLLHSGPDLAAWSRRVLPIEPSYVERVWETLSRFARAFVLAALVVAFTQGSLAYVGYRMGGVDRPAVWAVLTAVLSVVPVFGTGLVWGPLALLQWAQGDASGAAVIVVWSVLVVGTSDNIVRPLIIGSAAQLHPLLVFLAVFGGLLTLGVSGLLVGPMLVATLLALLSLYEEQRVGSK